MATELKKRFGEMWQQAGALTDEEDEAAAIVQFMQQYGELIVKECLWIVANHPEDAYKRIAETYEIDQ
jgi:hypothetical protein